jgi:hypothetical protein
VNDVVSFGAGVVIVLAAIVLAVVIIALAGRRR